MNGVDVELTASEDTRLCSWPQTRLISVRVLQFDSLDGFRRQHVDFTRPFRALTHSPPFFTQGLRHHHIRFVWRSLWPSLV